MMLPLYSFTHHRSPVDPCDCIDLNFPLASHSYRMAPMLYGGIFAFSSLQLLLLGLSNIIIRKTMSTLQKMKPNYCKTNSLFLENCFLQEKKYHFVHYNWVYFYKIKLLTNFFFSTYFILFNFYVVFF